MSCFLKNSLARRLIVIIVINLMGGLTIFHFYLSESLENQKLFMFPSKLERWEGRAVSIQNWVLKSLQTPYVVMRDYLSDDGRTVNLTIVWYDDKKIDFHAPELCLTGMGNHVIEKKSRRIRVNDSQYMDVIELLVDIHNMKALVYYYYLNETYVTNSLVKLRFQVFLEKLQSKRTSAAFVRLITPVKGSISSAKSSLDLFFQESLPVILEYTTVP